MRFNPSFLLWFGQVVKLPQDPKRLHFTEDSFEQSLVLRSFTGTLRSSFVNLYSVKKEEVPIIMKFLMESCKPAIGQNKNEKQVHNARRTADELLDHQFPQECLSRFFALESLQGPYSSRFPLSNQDRGMNDVINKSSWF